MMGQMAKRPVVLAPAEQTPLEVLVSDYLASCRARGLALGTIERAYSFSLKEIFLPWCQRSEITEAEQLIQRVFDRFTSDLYEKGGRTGAPLSRHTSHTYIRHVRQFLSWAAKEGEVDGSARPQLPTLPRKVLDVLSRKELDELEGAAATERDKLIVRILGDTGLRVGELCDLRVDDVTRHERAALLRVRGKGNKERLVPLRPELARRLDRFLRYRSADAKGTRVFVSLRRGPDGQYGPLTPSGVGQLLHKRAGL